MTSASIPAPIPRIEMSAKLAAGLGLAAAIAWIAPFDLAFDAATFGVPALRSLLVIVLALTGLFIAGRIGLGIEPRGMKRPVLTPLIIAAGVAVACAASDWAMLSSLHESYRHLLITAPLGLRLATYMMRAFNENIFYRLFLGSLAIWLIGRVWKAPDGRPAQGAYWTGFALSQLANIWINVTSQAPITPVSLLHDGLRYLAPGMVWSWLYWRRGFQSNEIASTGVHLFFQSLVTLGL